MAEIVRLKHITRQNNWKLYFYNGVVAVKNGVVELPADNFTRIRRAYLLGFRLNEDGQPISGRTHEEIVAQATVDSQEEQENAETRTRRGRQPSTDNRIRESESDSDGNSTGGGPSSELPSGSGEQESSEGSDSGDEE